MKRIVMTIKQIQTMVARQDGYDTREEWMQDEGLMEFYGNIYGPIALLGESVEMGFCRDGVTRWYTFEDDKGRPCIYYRH